MLTHGDPAKASSVWKGIFSYCPTDAEASFLPGGEMRELGDIIRQTCSAYTQMPPTREGRIPDLLCIHPDAPHA